MATLEELETIWSVDDALRALAVLQMRDDIDAALMPEKATE